MGPQPQVLGCNQCFCNTVAALVEPRLISQLAPSVRDCVLVQPSEAMPWTTQICATKTSVTNGKSLPSRFRV